MTMTEDDMIKGAKTAYFRTCSQYAFIYFEPCEASSEVNGDIVTLRNSYRELAKYRLVKDGPHSWFEYMGEAP